jgi:prephenate dehydrogenase
LDRPGSLFAAKVLMVDAGDKALFLRLESRAEMMERVAILGTGLIGASVGLALRKAGFAGAITGWDKRRDEAQTALDLGALTATTDDPDRAASESDVVVLATPVLGVLHWMERLAPMLAAGQLVTDVGSTKWEIAAAAQRLYPVNPGREKGVAQQSAEFLPGHPMAGKERGGAELAEADLFRGAMWLFTPVSAERSEAEEEWRGWVERMGARTMDMEARRHDEMCAWVSHLPQMLSTAFAALLEERFGTSPELAADLMRVGGRALRETTRLGASPYSMWRDVAMTNTGPLSAALLALEQELAHLRENLRTPELREEFARANRFRA